MIPAVLAPAQIHGTWRWTGLRGYVGFRQQVNDHAAAGARDKLPVFVPAFDTTMRACGHCPPGPGRFVSALGRPQIWAEAKLARGIM